MTSIKKRLYRYCQDFLNEKKLSIENEIRLLQSQANEETKSTAGDKYETSRAMIHLEIERYSLQLAELHKQKTVLNSINIDSQHETAQPGSIVVTNRENYFLSINAGRITVDEKDYICISSASPVGSKLMKAKAGDTFSFNKTDYHISAIF